MAQALSHTSAPVPFVHLVNNQPVTTSLAVADHFGKEHRSVLGSIRALIDDCPPNFNLQNFMQIEYKDDKGRTYPMYRIRFDGFMLLVMGYTGKKALAMKLAYIEAFNKLRAQLEEKQARTCARMDADAPITPDQQATLQAIVTGKVDAIPNKAGYTRHLFGEIWTRFKNHFRIAKYSQLPQSRMSEAIAYLMKMDVQMPAIGAQEQHEQPALPHMQAMNDVAVFEEYRKRRDGIAKALTAQMYETVKKEIDIALQDFVSPMFFKWLREKYGEGVPMPQWG